MNLASPISSGCDGVRLGRTGNNVNQGTARSARAGLQSDFDVPLMKPAFRSLSAHVHGGLSVALVGLILSLVSGEAQAVRSYDAPRAAGTSQIDGRLDDAWAGAPWTEAFADIRGKGWRDPGARDTGENDVGRHVPLRGRDA